MTICGTRLAKVRKAVQVTQGSHSWISWNDVSVKIGKMAVVIPEISRLKSIPKYI
jgi:hypothetical protein